MTAIGRILQALGWLWFGAAVAAAIFGFADLQILPGLILVFISRIIRTAARRKEGEQETAGAQPVPAQPERILNTERQSQETPLAAVRPSMSAESTSASKKRNELLESMVQTGQQAPVEAPAEELPTQLPEPDQARKVPKTSAEMIAEARRRWDRK